MIHAARARYATPSSEGVTKAILPPGENLPVWKGKRFPGSAHLIGTFCLEGGALYKHAEEEIAEWQQLELLERLEGLDFAGIGSARAELERQQAQLKVLQGPGI